MSVKIDYITSYNAKLYEATGKQLERSFSEHQAGKAGNVNLLLAYSEDQKGTRRIDKDYLNWYLNTFKHLIPPNLGGTANDGCSCLYSEKNNKIKHRDGCHNTLWNRNAYRWFHKVAALKTYIDSLNSSNIPDYLVWLDCDCYFKQHLSNQFIVDLMGTKSLAYLRGSKREAIESGILIFRLNRCSGVTLIEEWFNYYKSEHFLTFPRWDDGYVLTMLVSMWRAACIDLVRGKAISRPADDCPLTPYIGHNKGTHVREHQLF